MEITPRELRDAEIAEAFRGYNREVVNDLLERAAASIDASNARVNEVSERLKSAQLEADRSRETEDILHRTLLLAQRAADEAVAEAQQKAREMMEEAELESHKLLAEAQTEAQRRRDDERERLEEEVVDLAARRDTLLSDVDALTQFESEYRARLSSVLENDLTMLRERPSSAPGPVPPSHAVELPVAAEAFARVDTPDAYVETYVDTTVATYVDTPAETPADAPDDRDTNAPVDTGVVDEGAADHDARFAATDTVADADSDSGVASFFDAEADTDTDIETSDEGGAPVQSVTDFFGGPDTTHEVAAEVGPATREVDMTALFDADAPEAEAYAPPGSLPDACVRLALRERARWRAAKPPSNCPTPTRASTCSGPTRSTPRSSTTMRSSQPCARPSTTTARSAPAKKGPRRTTSTATKAKRPRSGTSSAAAAESREPGSRAAPEPGSRTISW